jgi:hypothetical protein
MPSLTVYMHPIKLTLKVLSFGGRRSPFSSTSSSNSEMVCEIPALANTWSNLPYSFSAALNIATCSFHDVTSTFRKGTEEASGSGRGFTSLAKTLPPCLMTRRRVARPIPEDAPTVLRTIKECHYRNALPVMMTTWSFMPSRSLSGI